MPCSIDSLPPEILSEILLQGLESFGDNIQLKWRYPWVVRGVSQRFYHIANNTRSIWMYLCIRYPLNPYLSSHISYSEPLPLVVDTVYDAGIRQTWTETINLLTPAFSRLASLLIQLTPDTDDLAIELLTHKMPSLELLCVKGWFGDGADIEFPPSNVPALRCFQLEGYLYSIDNFNLPQTLEELVLGGACELEPLHSRNFWSSLPMTLRVLRMEKLELWGVVTPVDKKFYLPCLTELRLWELCRFAQLSNLQCLDAPRLRTITLDSDDGYGAGLHNLAWVLDFPSLVHLEWTPLFKLPRLVSVLRQCRTLKSLHISLRSPSGRDRKSVSNLLTSLASDPTFLPLLEDLTIHGASPSDLRSLAQARPWLMHLRVPCKEFGLENRAVTEEHMEWREYEASAASQVAALSTSS